MKNILLLCAVLVLFCQCSKDKYKRGFEMTYTQYFQIIPGTILPFQKTYYELDPIQTAYADKFAEYGITKEEVETIVTKFVRLTIIFPNNENFDFSQRVFVYVTHDQRDYEIAFLEPVPETQEFVLNLIPNVTELKEFLTEEAFVLKFAFSSRYVPVQFIDIRADITFQVVPFED